MNAATCPIDLVLLKQKTDPHLLPPSTAVIFATSGGFLRSIAGDIVGIATFASDPTEQSKAVASVGCTDWILLDQRQDNIQDTIALDASPGNWICIPAGLHLPVSPCLPLPVSVCLCVCLCVCLSTHFSLSTPHSPENIISSADSTPTRICVSATSAMQVPGLAFALDLGVDALALLPPPLLGDHAESAVRLWEAAVIARAQRLERDAAANFSGSALPPPPPPTNEVQMETGVVTEVSSGGVGDRVALDFTQLLHVGEGVLVGSSAKMLVLVHGETLKTELVPARPFRVNAGACHSYVLLARGVTKYLSEVQAGDVVLVTDSGGENTREVTVGRCKVRRVMSVTYPRIPLHFSTSNSFLICFHCKKD
jgi:hypothetical protein